MLRKTVAAIAVLALIVGLMSGCGGISKKKAENLALETSMADYVLENLTVMDEGVSVLVQALSDSREYISGSIDGDSWWLRMEESCSELAEIQSVELSDELKERIEASSYSSIEFLSLSDTIDSTILDYLNTMYFIEQLFNSYPSEFHSYFSRILDTYEELASEYCIAFWFACNENMISMSEEVLESFRQRAQSLTVFENIADDWTDDSEEAVRLQDVHMERYEELMIELEQITAEMTEAANPVSQSVTGRG